MTEQISRPVFIHGRYSNALISELGTELYYIWEGKGQRPIVGAPKPRFRLLCVASFRNNSGSKMTGVEQIEDKFRRPTF